MQSLRILAAIAPALLLALLPLLAAFPAGGQTAGQPGESLPVNVEKAKLHFKKGIEFFNEEQWEQALGEFRKAFKFKPHWKIRYNIGLCYVKLEFWAQAMTELTLMFEEGGDNIPSKQFKKVKKTIGSLKNKIGVLKLEGEVKGVEVRVDGKPIIGLARGGVLFLNPGEHRVDIRSAGQTILSEDIALTGGQEKTLKIKVPESGLFVVEEEEESDKDELLAEELVEQERKAAKKKKAFTAAGSATAVLAGLALIAGLAAGINAIVEQDRQEDAYNAYLDDPSIGYDHTASRIDEHYDKAYDSANACTALLAVGGVLAAASLVIFLVPKSRREKKPQKSASLTILPSPGSLTLTLEF